MRDIVLYAVLIGIGCLAAAALVRQVKAIRRENAGLRDWCDKLQEQAMDWRDNKE